MFIDMARDASILVDMNFIDEIIRFEMPTKLLIKS